MAYLRIMHEQCNGTFMNSFPNVGLDAEVLWNDLQGVQILLRLIFISGAISSQGIYIIPSKLFSPLRHHSIAFPERRLATLGGGWSRDEGGGVLSARNLGTQRTLREEAAGAAARLADFTDGGRPNGHHGAQHHHPGHGELHLKRLQNAGNVKRRIAMAKEAFNRKRSIFCGSVEKEPRKRLAKSFVWSVALHGTETWALQRSEEKRPETFEMWIWRRMERVK
ncbi:hypothetical protein ANN_18974 [Periplaneta americana]|uniref:Uncharacterized protein n=1 Tax=Periplaneta americana TaxID=6978 RepID=A0ABQ8SQR4_PERAM|nr:hypothetical protein ANN_18974 [Periplaneta americana]